jgi:hypothetical protein
MRLRSFSDIDAKGSRTVAVRSNCMTCKRLRILSPANGNDTTRLPIVPQRHSEPRLRVSPVAARDLMMPLPEDVITFLHEQLDRTVRLELPENNAGLLRFEEAITDRLFPLRDERRTIVRLRLHSHVAAVAAAVVAAYTKVPVQAAFVCGWLHDIGIASCIRHLDAPNQIFVLDDIDECFPLILRSAPEHAQSLLGRWRLPSSLRHALRAHVVFDANVVPEPLACVIFVAEHLAALQGCGFRDEQPATGLRSRLQGLGLTEHDLLPLSRCIEQRLGHLELEWQTLRLFEEG